MNQSNITRPLMYDELPVCVPSKEVMTRWLYTHKSEFITDGVTRPGLFSTSNFGGHSFLVFLVICLEAAATWLAIEEGYEGVTIFMFIFLDFVIAISFHYYTAAKINKLKNHRILSTARRNQMNISNALKKWNGIRSIGHVLLLLSAFVKIYFSFKDTFFGQIEPRFAFIAIMYVMAALFHAIATGNFVAGLVQNISLSNAEKSCLATWGSKNGAQDPFINQIANPDKTALVTVNQGKHQIIKEGDNYIFKSLGYLLDSDLQNLISLQVGNSNAKAIIAREGVKFQLETIAQLPATNHPNGN